MPTSPSRPDSDAWQQMTPFVHTENGRERWAAHGSIPRHRHDCGYAAIVLAGGYEECGSRGRFRAGPGDVLLHAAFDAHLDRFQDRGADILNLIMADLVPGHGIGHIRDPDAVVRAAERDPLEADACLREQLCESQPIPEDWPDILAHDLLDDPDRRLDAWAEAHGLAAETVSRGFHKVFGMSPASYRAEARAHRALALIVGSSATLVSIAATTGFADQAHMSRAIRVLTGSPPSAWRRSNPFKTV